jgi:hypothetical protein
MNIQKGGEDELLELSTASHTTLQGPMRRNHLATQTLEGAGANSLRTSSCDEERIRTLSWFNAPPGVLYGKYELVRPSTGAQEMNFFDRHEHENASFGAKIVPTVMYAKRDRNRSDVCIASWKYLTVRETPRSAFHFE